MEVCVCNASYLFTQRFPNVRFDTLPESSPYMCVGFSSSRKKCEVLKTPQLEISQKYENFKTLETSYIVRTHFYFIFSVIIL